MIRQYDAQTLCDAKLWEYGLYPKGWRTIFTKSEKYIGRCWHDRKRIELSLMHLNVRSEADLIDTILHEIAHALVGHDHAHDDVWKAKAIELGLKDPKACGEYIDIDNGRAIQPSETKAKQKFNRVDKTCPICGAKAEEESFATFGGNRWTKLKCGHLVKTESLATKGFDLTSHESKSGKKLYPYQIKGIEFLESAGGRGLIADEPGLGKTAQAQMFTFIHKEQCWPVLWVCKTTLKLQALKELFDWTGTFAQIIHSPREFILPGMPYYIISMDLLRNMPSEKLEKIGFKTVVADEIQHFKNPDSSRTAELRKLAAKADFFIPLSGTPWKNRGQEYFPVLNMLDATRFPSYKAFKNRWVDYYLDKATGQWKQGGIKDIPKFRDYTKDMVIRRMRDDVLPDLPKVRRDIRFIEMETLYEESYEDAELEVANKIKIAMLEGKNTQSIGGEIMVLKHIAGLSKVKTTIEDVKEWLEDTPEEAKITIFHHHIDVGDFLQEGNLMAGYEGLDKFLKEIGLNPTLRLFGGRSPEERDDICSKFRDDIKSRVLIASTLASGEGLNLQFCQNAIMMERQWNPGNEEQAELRFSRPLTWGDYPPYLQEYLFNEDKTPKKPAIIIPYMTAEGTVDSMLVSIIERKRTEFRKTMNVGEENLKFEENDIIRELAELIMAKRLKQDASRASGKENRNS